MSGDTYRIPFCVGFGIPFVTFLSFFRIVWPGFRFDFLCLILGDNKKRDHCLREVGKSRVGLLEAVVFEGNFGVC